MRGWIRWGISVLALTLWAASTDAAAPEGQAGGPRVVARVNQVDVTYDDFKMRLSMLEKERGPVPPERYGEILRALVREEILYQAAKAQRLDEEAGSSSVWRSPAARCSLRNSSGARWRLRVR